mgnify:CR=1 FL=1
MFTSINNAIIEDEILTNTYKVNTDTSIQLELPCGTWINIYSNKNGTYNTISVKLWDKEKVKSYSSSHCLDNSTSKGKRTSYKDEKNNRTNIEITNFTNK